MSNFINVNDRYVPADLNVPHILLKEFTYEGHQVKFWLDHEKDIVVPAHLVIEVLKDLQADWECWKEDEQPLANLIGDISVTLCENVEKGKGHIALPIDASGTDGGYLHIEGWVEA